MKTTWFGLAACILVCMGARYLGGPNAMWGFAAGVCFMTVIEIIETVHK